MALGLDGRILFASAALAALILTFDLSLPLGVAGGVPYIALVLPGLWASGNRPVMVLAGIGTVLTIVGYFFSPPGGVWWVVLINRGLAIFAIWMTAILVANRKAARDALKAAHDELEDRVQQRTADLAQSEARFKDIADSASDWFWELDRDLRFTYVSDRYFEITGFRPEDRMGKLRTDGVDPADLAADAEQWAAHQADLDAHRPFRDFEYSLSTPNGGKNYFRISGNPAFDASGQFLGYRGTGTDTTRQERMGQSLKESERRYQSIFDAAQVGIIRTRISDGQVIDVNERDATMLGYENRADFLENYRSLEHWPTPEARAEWIREGLRDGFSRDRIIPMQRKDGSTVWLHTSATFHADLDCIDIVSIDITESRKQQTETDAARRDAEYANRVKSEFLAHFSHELRTPLNAILGFSEIMRRETFGPMDNDRYASYVGNIHRSGEHLLALISDILDLSRIEAGQLEHDEQVFDSRLVATDCVRLLQEQAERKGVAIELQCPDAGLFMRADERRLRQIMLNLVSNAVKFTQPDTVVSVGMEINANGEICFSVRDRGDGMHTEDLERVQEPFIRLDGALTANSEEGTGLGLAITKRLVESHGGKLCLSSEIGVGTTATVSFPSDRAHSEAGQEVAQTPTSMQRRTPKFASA